MPSPRPVRPSPSVVVADSRTVAPPSAADSAASPSARRGPTFGRLPITWTATLPIVNPAAVTRRSVSPSRAAPEAPAHCGLGCPEVGPEVAEPGRREQRVADRVRGDVGVGVPGQPVLPRPLEARQGELTALSGVGVRVHVHPDPDQRQPVIAPVPPAREDRLGQQQVLGGGDLERPRVPGHQHHRQAQRLDHPGVVGGPRIARRRARGAGRRRANPCGVWTARSDGPVDRARPAVGRQLADRVDDRGPGDHRRRPRRGPRRRPRPPPRPGPGTARRRGRARRRTPPGTTARASETDSARVAPPVTATTGTPPDAAAAASAIASSSPSGAASTTSPTRALGDQRAHRVGEDRLAREQGHGLGDAGTQPLTGAGGRDDRDDGAGFHGGHATDTNAHRPGSAVGVADAIRWVRTAGPRRGWPRPCPRWCARPAPAR